MPCKVTGCSEKEQKILRYFATADVDEEGYVYLHEAKEGDIEFDVCEGHYLELQSLVPTTSEPAYKLGDPGPRSFGRRHALVKPVVRMKLEDL